MARKPDTQLSLFAPTPPPVNATETSLAKHLADATAIASRLPRDLLFGTSSWSFPGWKGLVYEASRSESELARDGLREYVRHPLLRTVGIDRGYYAPIPRADLERYATQLPPEFPCCTKAPERITAPVALGHRGSRAGEPNPDFLSAERFMQIMGDDFAASFASNAGPFIFEFPPVPRAHRLAPDAFVDRLDRFLGALPRTFRYAVELRESSYLTPAYREVLAAHRVAHTFNYWTAMPHFETQLAAVPVDTADFSIVRLLLRPGTRYDERKNAFAPFDQLVDIDEIMRKGVITVVKLALASGRKVFVLVNNKAEGSAPLTIRDLAARIAS